MNKKNDNFDKDVNFAGNLGIFELCTLAMKKFGNQKNTDDLLKEAKNSCLILRDTQNKSSYIVNESNEQEFEVKKSFHKKYELLDKNNVSLGIVSFHKTIFKNLEFQIQDNQNLNFSFSIDTKFKECEIGIDRLTIKEFSDAYLEVFNRKDRVIKISKSLPSLKMQDIRTEAQKDVDAMYDHFHQYNHRALEDTFAGTVETDYLLDYKDSAYKMVGLYLMICLLQYNTEDE